MSDTHENLFLGLLMCPYGYELHIVDGPCAACDGECERPPMSLNERWARRDELLRTLEEDPPPGLVDDNEEDDVEYQQNEFGEDLTNDQVQLLAMFNNAYDNINSAQGFFQMLHVFNVADSMPLTGANNSSSNEEADEEGDPMEVERR